MADLIGKTLGPYRIIEQIGLGGMATVYKAYQPSMDRYVALKVLSTHLAHDTTFVKRFQQEARVIARLEHLHILPVYDHGEEDGYLYLVMRFIEAGTLKDQLEKGSLSLDEVRRIVTQVGSALEYAHQLGVIHRDIKPSNVLITPQGDCFLTDFGIAKMVEGTLGLTGSGVLGTPHYMAPEQSQSLKVDHRADVYAMGVVVYEMVTGRVPFDAETPFAVVMKHVTEPLPLPRNLRPDLPEAVERVILRALAKDPADRYQSVRDLVTGFDQAVSGAPDEVRTAVTPPRATQLPTLVEETQAEPTAVVPGPATASISAWRQWTAGQPPWLLPAAGLALIVLVLAGLIVSQIPGRVEISGGQVQVVLPTTPAAPAPTAAEAAQATASPTPRPTPAPPKATAPGSTAEQARAFAAPILAAIKDRPPDYQDDFGNSGSGWAVGTTLNADAAGSEKGQTGYADGEYFVTAAPASSHPQNPQQCITCMGGSSSSLPELSDVVLEVDGHFVAGENGDWHVHLREWSYHVTSTSGGYAVTLNTGQVNILRNDDSKSTILGQSQAGLARPGTATNHLQIIAKGPQIAVLVNGQPAAFVTYTNAKPSEKGIIRLMACNSGDTPLRAQFDNLKIWDISQPASPSAAAAPQPSAQQHADLANTYIAGWRWDEALAEISQAIELDPANAEYYRTRARVYDEGKGMMGQAAADATKAVELAPASWDAWATRGGVYLHMGKCSLSAADFDRAIQLDPKRFEGYGNRADALGCAGKLDEAIADYNRALEISPTSSWAHWTRGMTYQQKGDLAAALADYSQAIKLNPGDTREGPSWYLSRAGVYRAQGQHQQALGDCAAILALVPDDPRGFYCRGMSEAALSQTDQARADFKQAVALTPASAWDAWVTEAAQTELNKIGP